MYNILLHSNKWRQRFIIWEFKLLYKRTNVVVSYCVSDGGFAIFWCLFSTLLSLSSFASRVSCLRSSECSWKERRGETRRRRRRPLSAGHSTPSRSLSLTTALTPTSCLMTTSRRKSKWVTRCVCVCVYLNVVALLHYITCLLADAFIQSDLQ